MTPSLLPAALAYAAAGIPIVPLFEPAGADCSCRRPGCQRPGKHPRNHGGLTNASTAPDVITDWWRRWPGANIGGRTGVVFDVCDVDGPDGTAALAPVLKAYHGLAPLVRTGSGGWHLIYAPTGLGNRVRFLPGVDWRGTGGYVVLPPSRHASGRLYAFVRPLSSPPPAVPAPLLTALTPAPPAASQRDRHHTVARPTGYGPAALAREADTVATTREGRNNALNRAAFNLGQLIATGHLTEDDVISALTDAALEAGLTPTETARTITSGLNAGQRHPRNQSTHAA